MNFFSPAVAYLWRGEKGALAEHLGYSSQERLIIISADDFGICPQVNDAIVELHSRERITSTAIMVPAQAYRQAATACRDNSAISCGVHLTLTSNYAIAPLQPITCTTEVGSLVDDSGRFHFTTDQFFARGTPADALIEAKAQIEQALADGIDVTHLDSHEGTLQLAPQFAEIYLQLATEYDLPLRMASPSLLAQLGLDSSWLDKARQRGIHFPDNLIYLPFYRFATRAKKETFLLQLIESLPAGVTEFYFHPSFDSPAARKLALSSPEARDLPDPDLSWKVRLFDYQILSTSSLNEALRQAGAILLNYKSLRILMRL